MKGEEVAVAASNIGVLDGVFLLRVQIQVPDDLLGEGITLLVGSVLDGHAVQARLLHQLRGKESCAGETEVADTQLHVHYRTSDSLTARPSSRDFFAAMAMATGIRPSWPLTGTSVSFSTAPAKACSSATKASL